MLIYNIILKLFKKKNLINDTIKISIYYLCIFIKLICLKQVIFQKANKKRRTL